MGQPKRMNGNGHPTATRPWASHEQAFNSAAIRGKVNKPALKALVTIHKQAYPNGVNERHARKLEPSHTDG